MLKAHSWLLGDPVLFGLRIAYLRKVSQVKGTSGALQKKLKEGVEFFVTAL